jgi:hypothetical protein
MPAYHTVNAKEFASERRRRYPFSRSDFRPAAYVVLTQKSGVTLEGCHD